MGGAIYIYLYQQDKEIGLNVVLSAIMTAKKKVLITTAIDYANDVIHIGHAYQKILADCLARIERLRLGKENVYFLTGTDEYGSTNQKAAEALGLDPKKHVDIISQKDKAQLDALNISYDRFIRTTDLDHKKYAQEVFQKSLDNGDIYLAKYKGLYCVGCESYKTASELSDNGQCVLHPTRKIQEVEEENYFFKWSKYAPFLKKLLGSDFCLPESKKREMLSFLEQGLEDIPVSRPKNKVSWGIDLPNDPDHVMYVWFDALVNYYTAGIQTGFWDDDTKIVHILGKDNTRFHALLWPAMLKSAGIRLPDKVYSHGFINLNGEKISKSRGNVIRPSELVNQFGVDTVRYYFLRYGPIVEDVNISLDHLKEIYNGDLANGLGNTVSRVAKLVQNSGQKFPIEERLMIGNYLWNGNWLSPLENYRVDLLLVNVWQKIAALEKHINENTPWSVKDPAKLGEILEYEVNEIREIAHLVEPFIPGISQKIKNQFLVEEIKSADPIFPRFV